MSWLDELAAPAPMQFAHGELWHRDRRKLVQDRYNPAKQVPGGWDDDLDTINLPDCNFDSGTSTDVGDAARTSSESTATLFCAPDADVRVGDRVWRDAEPDLFFYVNARPQADTNPFTEWRPVMQVPLDLTEG